MVGPGQLRLNSEKPVYRPGPHQILTKVEAVGLCFSDMKLLKQFDQHPRKVPLASGLAEEILREIPTYKPDTEPTVPGHELCVRVVEVGHGVTDYQPGQRWLVQPDWRLLKTPGANGACGYNFEGALQEYLLLDERVLGSPRQVDTYNMMPAPEENSASAVALVEPWACVENSYVTPERQGPKPGGRMLVVVGPGRMPSWLGYSPDAAPAELLVFAPAGSARAALQSLESDRTRVRLVDAIEQIANESVDDVVAFTHDPTTLESVSDKLAKGGIVNVVLGGAAIGRKVTLGMGRIHYGYTRWVGTPGFEAADGWKMIPANGEFREGESVLVVGAGGPMGQMHVIRALSRGLRPVASDLDDARLEAMRRKASAVGTPDLPTVNSRTQETPRGFGYVALMAPVPALVEQAVELAAPRARVNVFAGIPAPVKAPLDLDAVIRKQVFVFGTSGSEPADMRTVLAQVVGNRLDTDLSVSAVSGMAGAIDGLKAVEDRSLDGKIIVYPELHDLDLVPLADMAQRFPSVAAKMRDGTWNKQAEAELLRVAAQ